MNSNNIKSYSDNIKSNFNRLKIKDNLFTIIYRYLGKQSISY